MSTIERMYEQSNNSSVVLLCHSMGCKTAHYLLNFVLYRLGAVDGQKWLDKHIHSYVPVGAPHVGAPKSVRAIIDGDKMGLDAFLDDSEGMVFGRSLGSGPWLFPLERESHKDSYSAGSLGPQSTTVETVPLVTPQFAPTPPVILRQESSIHITIPCQSLPLKSFTHNHASPPSKLRLAIYLGKDLTVRTNFIDVSKGNSAVMNLANQTWVIACPPTIQESLKLYPFVQLFLEEPGAGKPTKKRVLCHIDIFWPVRVAWCIIKWILCLPCSIVSKLLKVLAFGAKRGVSEAAGVIGTTRLIGESGKVDWKRGLVANSKTNNDDGGESGSQTFDITAKMEATEGGGYGFFLIKPPAEILSLKVKWEAPAVLNTYQSTQSTTPIKIKHRSKNVSYISCSTKQLLQLEGLTNALHLLHETYGNDPIAPHSISSWHPPPVKRVTAIYGVNLPTEVSGVYCRTPCVKFPSSGTREKQANIQPMFVLDKFASLDKDSAETHSIEKGLIRETSNTPQEVIGSDGTTTTKEYKSGDGTVPYWSLQQCRLWQGRGVAQCEVTVHEIDKAEHREILNDARFHKILLELLN